MTVIKTLKDIEKEKEKEKREPDRPISIVDERKRGIIIYLPLWIFDLVHEMKETLKIKEVSDNEIFEVLIENSFIDFVKNFRWRMSEN